MKEEKMKFASNSITNLIFVAFFAYSPATFFALVAMALHNFITSIETANLVSALCAPIYIYLIIAGYSFIEINRGEKIKKIYFRVTAILSSIFIAGAGYWIYSISRIRITEFTTVGILSLIPGLTCFSIYKNF